MKKIGRGVFSWDSTERRSNRYGSFHLADRPYDGEDREEVALDIQACRDLCGKRVHLVADVVATRESGHIGDVFLGIYPSKPQPGERIDLGVGVLDLTPSWEEGSYDIVLKPEDGRAELWIDPRQLYRLHDQTVNIHVEETDAPCTPMADLTPPKDGVILDKDGDFQIKTHGKVLPDGASVKILPKIERLGDGMFSVSSGQAGERYDIIIPDSE